MWKGINHFSNENVLYDSRRFLLGGQGPNSVSWGAISLANMQ